MRYLIGIDEAGRGPLAGPVAVAAFAVKSKAALRIFRGVKDSKQLRPEQRDEWFTLIRSCAKKGTAMYAVSMSRAETIDRQGLSRAVAAALGRCLKKLERLGCAAERARILLDGLLYASPRFEDQQTIIDGDSKEPVIALASICAKVTRDRRMILLAKKHPEYGFDMHKGYGTKAHYRAIKKYGLLPIHRKSFLNL
ncbi:MAG: ribonuclease [Candidatus Parcubacteria bacterium]|jgi:ribonuclease HII|nr:ribonuclease [Candidatus Parcubacteria bacterium]